MAARNQVEPDYVRFESSSGLPPVPDKAWLIRTRSDYQTAQMTGVHSLSPLAPMFIGHRIGVHQAEHQELVYYFTSYSKTFNKTRSHRYHTRYDVRQSELKDSWQQLGVTEFVMIQEGDFATKDQLALQTGYLQECSAVGWILTASLPATCGASDCRGSPSGGKTKEGAILIAALAWPQGA